MYAVNEFSVYPLTVSNPIYIDSESNFNSANANYILSHFNLNYGSINKETTADGALVYVENLSSMTLDPDGDIHYLASQTNGGIALKNYIGDAAEKGYTQQDVVAAAQLFLDSFDNKVLGGKHGALRIKNVYYNNQSSTFDLEFSYTIDGMPVYFEDKKPAVTIKYANGYFTQVFMRLRTYEKSSEKYNIGTAKECFHFFSGKQQMRLSKIEIGYNDKGLETINPEYLLYWSK